MIEFTYNNTKNASIGHKSFEFISILRDDL